MRDIAEFKDHIHDKELSKRELRRRLTEDLKRSSEAKKELTGSIDQLRKQVEEAVYANDPVKKELLLTKAYSQEHQLQKELEREAELQVRLEDAEHELKNFANSLAVKYPKIAVEAHDWDPTTISHGSNQKLQWGCRKKGHIYKALVHNRVYKKSGCPYCANKKILVGYNDLATTHPHLAEELYTTDGRDVFPGTHKPLVWECPASHKYWKSPYLRTKSKTSACPVCKAMIANFDSTIKEDPAKYQECLHDQRKISIDNIGIGVGRIENESWRKSLNALKESILEKGQQKNIRVFTRRSVVDGVLLRGDKGYQLIDGGLRLQALTELSEEHPEDRRFARIHADIFRNEDWVVREQEEARGSGADNRRTGKLGQVAEALEAEMIGNKKAEGQGWQSVSILPDLEIRARGEYADNLQELEMLAKAIRLKITAQEDNEY
jgi:hypothetical protein